MGELEQATVAFGQGLSVTPIQLVTAFRQLSMVALCIHHTLPKALMIPLPMIRY